MNRTLARWLVAGALAGFGFLAGANAAWADTEVNGSNESNGSEVGSGNGSSNNDAEAEVGQQSSGGSSSDIEDTDGRNVQEGDNEADVNQSAESQSGDGVGGQVVGVVSEGDTTVNATNRTEDVDVETGDAEASNNASGFVGQFSGSGGPGLADIDNVSAVNVQEGDNEFGLDQDASAFTGDGVAGQVIGVVVGPDGSADVTASNVTEDADVDTGDSTSTNTSTAVVGQLAAGGVNNVNNGSNGGTSGAVGDSGSGLSAVLTSGSGVGSASTGSGSGTSGSGGSGAAATQGDNGSVSGPQTSGLSGSEQGALGMVNQQGEDPATDDVGALDIENVDAANVQEGDNEVDMSQSATAESGDGVAGQIIGVVSGGDAVVNATNVSEDVDVETGDAIAANDAAGVAAQIAVGGGFGGFGAQDIENVGAVNVQEGDNEFDLSQSADAATGDGVAGQIIGVVTTAGGSADVTASNLTEDADVDTGDADADNDAFGFAGQIGAGQGNVAALDIENVGAVNVQEGDNELDFVQSSDASTGDGVAGSVIGVVSSGDAVVNATNVSLDVDVETGDATAGNTATGVAAQIGVVGGGGGIVNAQDIENVGAVNVQEGDNEFDLVQSADASTGDGVAGQIIGVVTTAGGSADVTASNLTEDADVDTGDADADNDAFGFTGQIGAVGGGNVVALDIENVGAVNVQEGDNELDFVQSSDASTGDGVGGQIVGVVSSGNAVVNASNVSLDVDVETGDATAANTATGVTGQIGVGSGGAVVFDIENVGAANVQEGDNEFDLSQSADASTGDGVGGQVLGVVSGGNVVLNASNVSEDVDVETGDALAANGAFAFVGQLAVGGGAIIVFDIEDVGAANVQEGDNELSAGQSSSASTGDTVGGQVGGVVASGTVDATLANTSEDVDVESGDSATVNGFAFFIGQLFFG